MSQRTNLLAILASVLLVGAGALAMARADSDKDPSIDPRKAKAPTMTKAGYSASDETFFRGLPLSKAKSLGWPGLEPRLAAADKFPTLASCIVGGARNDGLDQIDWAKVKSDVEAEVCLARVANALGGAEKTRAWLDSQGFKIIAVRDADEGTTSIEAPERSGTVVEAFWPADKHGPLVRGSFLTRTLQNVAGNGTSVLIFVSKPSAHVSVNVTTNYL